MGELCVDGKVISQLILYEETLRVRNLNHNINDRDHWLAIVHTGTSFWFAKVWVLIAVLPSI